MSQWIDHDDADDPRSTEDVVASIPRPGDNPARHKTASGTHHGGEWVFDKESKHLESYFLDLANGNSYHRDDFVKELRIDTGDMPAWDSVTLKEYVKDQAAELKKLHDAGCSQEAWELAREAAAYVAEKAGGYITPHDPNENSPDDPRELAKLIRRQ